MPNIGQVSSQSGRVPGIPTITDVTAGDGSASVAFTEPAYKGKGSVTYTVTASPGGATGAGSSSPITVSGLTNGVSYTFTIKTNTPYGILSSLSSASNSIIPVLPFSATGGTVVTSGGYKYHTFTSSGAFTVVAGSRNIETLVIAGGGEGAEGDFAAGGGGAGGVLYNSTTAVSVGAYAIVVGGNRTDSTFGNTLTAVKGGYGGSGSGLPGYPGGSGGGGGGYSVYKWQGGKGTAGQGYDGGTGGGGNVADPAPYDGNNIYYPTDNNSNQCAGGGGGAGGAGGSASVNGAGNGGAGTSSFSTWASATGTGISGYYAGGGGGASSGGRTKGNGGAGGGGAGITTTDNTGGTAAPANSGSGGGGGATTNKFTNRSGGAGGSGIVIVRYSV